MADYDPKSSDSMFSRILERMDTQDQTLGRIESSVTNHGLRLSAMEQWKAVTKAQTAMIAGAVSSTVAMGAWIAKSYFGGPR